MRWSTTIFSHPISFISRTRSSSPITTSTSSATIFSKTLLTRTRFLIVSNYWQVIISLLRILWKRCSSEIRVPSHGSHKDQIHFPEKAQEDKEVSGRGGFKWWIKQSEIIRSSLYKQFSFPEDHKFWGVREEVFRWD